jgi:hypothetical protein
MTGVLALACFLSGFIAAWLLRTTSAMAQASWSQERLQRKIQYWQDEAIHARTVAEQVIRQLAVCTGREPEAPDWPTVGLG